MIPSSNSVERRRPSPLSEAAELDSILGVGEVMPNAFSCSRA